MIDWYAKVQQLKASADELDLWATRTEGRGRLVLGRMADELRLFAVEVTRALVEPEETPGEPLPEWLAQEVVPQEAEGEPLPDQPLTPQFYDQQEANPDEWYPDQTTWDEDADQPE